MRIQRIRAVNFLSHADTTLDLHGFNAFVIVGKNGAGKSAILIDVPLITFFGKGRATTKDVTLDDYVKNGKDFFKTEVEFMIEPNIYRAAFTYSMKGKGSSLLTFDRIHDNGSILEEMTQGGVDETRARIQKIIGYDRNLLVKTSIIEQGQAETFCMADPSERMDILSQLWDLEKYDELGALAKEERVSIEATVKANDQKKEQIHGRVIEAEQKEADLEPLWQDSAKKDRLIKGYELKKTQLQGELAKLEGAQKELETVNGFIRKADTEIQMTAQAHEDLLKKITRFDKILKNQDVVRGKVLEEKEKEAALVLIESEIEGIEGQIEATRRQTETTRKEFQGKIDAQEQETQIFDAEIAKEKKNELALQKTRGVIDAKKERLTHLETGAQGLKGIVCHPEVDPSYINEGCRLLVTAIGAKKAIPSLMAEIMLEERKYSEEYGRIEATLGLLEEKRAKSLSQASEVKKALSGAILAIETEINRSNALRKEKGTEKEAVKNALVEIRKYTVLLPEIDLAEKEIPTLKDEERCLADKTTGLLKDKTGYEIDKLGLLKILLGRTAIEQDLRVASESLSETQKDKEMLIKKIGAIEEIISQVEPMKAEIKSIETENEKLTGEKAILMILEEAYKAIPFMVVSQGINSVENKANQILTQISQNGLQVQVRTAEVTKTTKRVKDNVNLVITDRDGEKKYKMLSGGERLRVAMALRLAISEVLAHRRAVRIESLTADEPFGPLDDGGVEDMKECLRNLKGRFRVMGVVTHDERAKDLFPVQIEITRGKEGAEVRVSEGT
jgi:exonuclease SbcC